METTNGEGQKHPVGRGQLDALLSSNPVRPWERHRLVKTRPWHWDPQLPRAAPGVGWGSHPGIVTPVVFRTKRRNGRGKEQMEVGLEGARTRLRFTFLKGEVLHWSGAPLQQPRMAYRKKGR